MASFQSVERCDRLRFPAPAFRPLRHFQGFGSPAKQPDQVDRVIFRENTEGIFAGIEYQAVPG